MSLPPMAAYPAPYPRPITPPPQPEVGTMFTESFSSFRRDFGRLLLVGAIPGVLAAAGGLGLVWLLATQLMTSLVSLNDVGLAGGALLVIAMTLLVIWLVEAQCGAMIAQLADAAAAGRPISLPEAIRNTRTLLPRVLVPYVALAAGTWLGLTVVAGATTNAIRTAMSATESRAGGAILALLGMFLLFGVLIGVTSVLLRVKLFLFLPTAGLEGKSGFESLRRSWELTRGVFGRILAAQLLVGLAVGIVGGLTCQLASVPEPTLTPGQLGGGLQDLLATLMPGFVVSTIVGAVIQAFTFPFLTIMSTVVFRYRTRPMITNYWPGGYPPVGYRADGYPAAYPQQGVQPQPPVQPPQPGNWPPVQPPQPGYWPPVQPPQPGYWPPPGTQQQPGNWRPPDDPS